jgi:hypothetical protein
VARVEGVLVAWNIADAKTLDEVLAVLIQTRVREGVSENPRVRATYRTPDGEGRFSLEGSLDEFTQAGAFFEPTQLAIVINTFGTRRLAGDDAVGDLVKGVRGELGGGPAPRAGIPFELALRGLFFHELLHAFWWALDEDVRALLVRHARDLGVLSRTYHEFRNATHWEPRKLTGNAKDHITVREMYEAWGSTPAEIEEEGATHFVQLAMAGALKAEDVAPVRHILEALFNGTQEHVVRALDGEPRPRLHSRQFALEGPQDALRAGPEGMARRLVGIMLERGFPDGRIARRVSEMTRGELEPREVRPLIREARERSAAARPAVRWEAEIMAGNPATAAISESWKARAVVEILEACRS